MIKKKGLHVTELTCAQANIPTVMYEAIRAHAESEGFNMSTYFRRWIVEGYKQAVREGKMR